MNVTMVCMEDGIMACGFRKFAGSVERLVPNSRFYFVSTNNLRSLSSALIGNTGGGGELSADLVDEIAQGLADSDLLGFSSMTGYAGLTKAVISRVREINPLGTIVWGGIHPIIHPEDAILAEVDAICTGEGEFAFEQFFDAWKDGRDYTDTRNFWFRENGKITRNGFCRYRHLLRWNCWPLPDTRARSFFTSPMKAFGP